jgi:multidrug efflux pump subunit AcrA (membrane-fusion protein)
MARDMKRIVSTTLFIVGCLLAARVNAGEELRVENVLLTLIEEVELPAKEPGAMAKLEVREGDVVEPGRQLAVIEDDEARMAASKAERELAIARTKAENDVAVRFARKAHEVAAAEFRRAQESVEKFHKSVSATEMDQLRLTTEKALLEIEQAELEQSIARLTLRQKETELESVQLKLKRHRLVAPFAGMVVQIKKHRGEWVNPGDSVLRLVRLDRLRLEAFVPARDFAAHLQGRRVTVIVDAPHAGPKRFEGTVVFVSPEVNPVNEQVQFWAEVDNQELLLRPGQPATMVVEADSSARQIDRPKSTR